MKRFLVTSLVGLCMTAAVAWAESASGPVVDDGYGNRVALTDGVDLTGVDQSFLLEPDIRDMRPPRFLAIIQPVMHPDGKSIVFTNREEIFTVPVQGGQPRLLFDSHYIHTFEGVRYVIGRGIMNIAGFSPDGASLYFTRTTLGEGRARSSRFMTTATAAGSRADRPRWNASTCGPEP